MKKRYTSDPKQAFRRNAFANNLNNKRIFLTLLAFLLLGGEMAWAQVWSPNVTSETTYYIQTYKENNNPVVANSTYGTYKFQYRESSSSTWSSAQNYITEFVVNCSNTSDCVKLIFQTTEPVGFMNHNSGSNKSAFTVKNGILQMELGTGYESTVTLKRVGGFDCNQNTSAPFFLAEEAGDATKKQLIIKGNPPTLAQIQNVVNTNHYNDLGYNPTEVWQDTCTFLNTNQFVIDGGYTFSSASWNESTGDLTVSGSGDLGKLSLFRLQTGTLELTNVTIQNARNSANNSGIHLMTNYGSGKNVALKMTHCWMDHFYAPNYPGVGIQVQVGKGNNAVGTVEINRCKFSNIFDADGADAAIRSVSSSTASLSVDSCVIWRNFGGGIRWQSLIAPAAQISNTVIKGNFNKVSGGGIFAKAGIALSNCKITNNTALSNGGGINYITFDEGSTQGTAQAGNVYPKSLDLSMDATTVIDGNKAINGYGGGVCIEGGFIYLGNNVGAICYEYDDNGQNPQTFKISMNQNGATISNNEAYEDGGGVYISRKADATFYQLQCNLTYGTISGNKTSSGNGGGVSVNTPSTYTIDNRIPYSTVAALVPQDVTVTIGREGETTNKISIDNNTAATYGGGMYVEAYPITYNNTTSAVSTTVYDYSEIKTNTATSHGGGLYVKRGTVNVAKTGTVQPLIQGNMANTYHGGGIYLDNGEINISGGLVKDNKATAHGGGIYNNNGTISLTNSSEVSGNKAGTYNSGTYGNGGGIYTQTGSVNITNSSVQGNECQKLGGGIYTLSGNITLTNATIGGDKTANEGNQTVHDEGDGGGIYTQNGAVGMTGSAVQGNTAKRNGGGVYVANNSVTMHSCTIGGSEAKYGNTTTTGSGGGIYVGTGAVLINPDETGVGNPSDISYNTAKLHGGGMYVDNGRVVAYGSFTESHYYPITITYNTATTGSGGGIFCMGNGATTYFDIRLRRVIVSHNMALGTANASSPINLGCGGGMYLDQGKISVISGNINNNEANVGGGGIYTREGDININGTQDEHTATQITYNTAGLNGGGVNTHSGTVTILGNSPSQRINISGNTATTGSGGGIFCYGTNVNTKYITLLHADLNDNHAAQGGGTQTVLGDVVSGRGGGMYLQKGIIDVTDVKIQQNTAKFNGGGINNHEGNIDVNGCLIGGGSGLGNMAGYDSSTGQQNTEGSGGGIYTNAGDIDIEDYVETTGGMTRIESKITHNTAVLNGGGADTRSGTIYVNRQQRGDQIEISHNTAKKGGGLYANAGTIYTYNALIDNNTATLNGGGINNHAGDIFIYGGSLSNNTATEGRGGGAYTDVGDIDIMYFPYNDDHQDTLYGTKIYNNIARLNGGAVNNHTGLVDVRYATIRNNTSTLGNGGAIYCEGPHANTIGKTIRLQRSILDRNKTRGADGTATDPTGRGGGIYLKYGSIFAQGAIITRNSANINGGGVDNHDGDIRLYGCIVDNNTAVEGSGGGVYTLHGDITTGPCYLYKATQITNNTAALNGGGINNGDLSVSSADKGNIYLNGDLIKGNTAQNGDGGGIYIADGQIDMFGGKIAENTANSGNGGGVYSGGGEFNIQKRQGKPVIEVIDITPSTTAGQYVVHYHLMHTGTSATSTHKHGFWYGKESDETGTEVQYTNSGLTPGCYKDGACLLSGLDEATTYWVKAYAENDQGETVSDKAWFTTLSSSKPTVHTGGSADVTKNSATLNGKWIDQGSSNITEVGFVYSLTETNPTIGESGCNTVSSTDIDGKFFTLPLTGLTPEKSYSFRAYAINGNATDNTGYGEVATFTTLKNTPDMGSATVDLTTTTDQTTTPFTNTITASFTMPAGTNFTDPEGANYITSYGFVWSTDDDPELYSDHTIPGTLTSGTTFTATYVGARGGLTVYVRAYASSNADEPAAMNITNYSISTPTQTITPSTDGSPVVRAFKIQDITQHSADIYGRLVDNGTSAITQYGIVWSATNAEPTLESNEGHNTVTASLENGDEFTLAMTGLDPGKTYYVRTFATNSTGTAYSNNYNFTALGITMPHVAIDEVTDITETSAKVQCSFTDGGANVTNWGVKYSTNSDMSGAIDVNQPGTLSGNTFTADLPEALTAYTTYYVQAYATNSAGTHTCRAITFMTADNAIPTVDQLALSSISLPTGGSNQSTISYQVTPATSTTVKTHGVAWSTLQKPKRQESEVTNTHFAETTGASVASATTFTKTRTQAYPNMTYYVRAYASKEDPDANNTLANIVYSNEISFVTLPVVATPEGDDAVSNLTNNSATLKGTIVSRDTEGHLRDNMRGVCWSTSTNPTRTGTNYAEETITTTSGVSVNYAVNATSLTAGTTYYYRAYYYRSFDDNAITYGEERTFTTKAYGLYIAASPTEGGTVNKTHVGLNNGETCEVTATANAGYTFNNWTVSGTGAAVSDASNATTTFTMGTSDATLTANFTINSHTVTLTANPAEGTVSGGGSYAYNSSVTVTATPESGYQFVNWTNGSDEEVSTDASYTFNMPDEDVSLTANFEPTRGSQTSRLQNTPRPRDIYPAPAREPWLWDEDPLMQPDDTLAPTFDTLAYREETQTTSLVDPIDIPLVEHNTAQYGGGIYMDKNTTSPAKLVFSGGSSTGERGKIMYNYASEAGGGIYIDTTALMHMKGHCEVNANHVPKGKNGGGIYLKGRLYVGETGTSASENGLIVNQNFAMDGFDETSYSTNPATYTTANKLSLNNVLLARHTYYYAHTTPVGTYDDEATVITLLSDISGKDGGGNPYSNIGFHVSHGFCPVIATSYAFGGEYALAEDESSTEFHGITLDTYELWLSKLMEAVGGGGTLGSNSAVFEDTESYIAIHTPTPGDPFHSKYIYLWGCWTHPAVLYDPETSHMNGQTNFQGHYKITNPDDNADPASNTNPLHWEIYSAEGLAWFSSYVNGLNAFKDGDIGSGGKHYPYNANKNPNATAKLMNDIDLSAYYWVPIGSVTQFNGATPSNITDGNIFTDNNDHHFKGTIDGQGHTITGMKCQYVSGIFENGLVGYLDGGTVKNLFIDEAIFVANNHATKGNYIGGIAGSMEDGATISSVEVRTSIDVSNVVNNKDLSYVGGLVGQMKGTGNTIHSSMALPQITGAVDYMGGLVGAINADNKLYNSFSNPKFPDATTSPYYAMNTGKYIGGLVGENNGTVENCYSRLQGSEPTSNGSTSVFGWLAGDNKGSINYSYAPQANISGGGVYKKKGTDPTGHGTYTATTRESGKYGFKHRDQALTLAAGTNTFIDNDHLEGGLMTALNNWVTAKGATTYHPWMRTMASGINDDLPILNFKKEGSKALVTDPLYNVVASKDGYYLEYALDVNDKLTEYAALSSGTPEIYLYDANTQSDGTTHQDITVTNIGTTPEVKLYIHEDVGIKVSGAASSTGLKARVGVTIKNDRADENDPNWHLFSSAILNAPIGLEYHTDDATTIDMSSLPEYTNGTYAANIVNNASKPQHLDNVYGVRQYFDPPQTTWSSTDIGYFPTNTPYGTWRTTPWNSGSNPDPKGFFDLYDYSEPHYHWINYKREGSASYMDHWHMDPEHESMLHYKINYTNATTMPAGKGWLMALSSESMMMTDGTLNTGDKTVNVTRTADYANTPPNGSYGTYTGYAIAEWRGLNLIGNPYQSYLNFNDFYNDSENIDIIWPTYGTREDGGKAYLYYTVGNSTPYDAYPNIHPHQGFFVKVKEAVGNYQLKFKDDMRVAGVVSTDNSPYRSELNYPLVALNCYDANGYYDRIRVEINRPELGGGGKMYSLHSGNAMIYASFEGQDYHTLFAPEGVSEVPVRFEAFEDGNYTMKWETYNGHFSYLHLIDNLTGNDVDCLTTDEYTYEGKKTDYHSRFKLVFQCTGVDENTDDDATHVNFAFQHEDELIVNGEGFLQLFDVTGRCLMTADVHGEQSSLVLPPIATGVYLLRLSGDQVKVQKIIIQ